ncbi:DUF1801 domain-containing protein [uncultured Cocleimonas sp.]|uniref:DUF1801 domain-containing protein n=1 Tax=uncultured Cocleimonas sp. TaxID=1051587 RepID=UPI00262B296A|nr:DUF1801 domain-containing protein [uncultured Cocleimonas sp.]
MPDPDLKSLENVIQSDDVKHTYGLYPETIQKKLLTIRQMIFDLAKHNDEISDIEETLKWGEPAYKAKSGSTVRLTWKASTPNDYAVYLTCSTTLVETFREIYPDTFRYDGNRAIIFSLDETIPKDALKQCLLLCLTYHKIKHLPLLGL